MIYGLVIVAGAIVGFVAGQSLRGSRHGSPLDAVVGAIGGAVALPVAIRFLGAAAVAPWYMSLAAAIVGALVTVFIVGQFTMPKKDARRR